MNVLSILVGVGGTLLVLRFLLSLPSVAKELRRRRMVAILDRAETLQEAGISDEFDALQQATIDYIEGRLDP